MSDCRRWSPSLYSDWAGDFNLVWGEVPGAKRLCDRLIEAESSGDMNDWDIYQTASELKQAWDQRTIRSGMRIVGKGRTTRAVFATDVRFNGLGASEETNEEATVQDHAGSRKRVATDNPQRPRKRTKTMTRTPCWGCKGQHPHFLCPLILGSDPKKIEVEYKNRQTFDKRMKDITFAQKIKKLREAKQITKELAENAEAC
ncbi:hypothetical protein V8E54_005805 [Elaphomyces granulatus]